MNTLLDLYNLYKPSKYDFFLPIYDRHFSGVRDAALSVLEIGVQYGYSLRMWRDYFPNAQIYGIDITDRYEGSDRDRITLFSGDAQDPIFLNSVMGATGKIDVIIDDGGHYPEQIISSFETLIGGLASSGLYAIEDLGASYWDDYGGSYLNRNHNRNTTIVEYLKGLVDSVNSDCWHSDPSLEWGKKMINHPTRRQDNVNIPPTYIDTHISAVHFYPMLAIMEKR